MSPQSWTLTLHWTNQRLFNQLLNIFDRQQKKTPTTREGGETTRKKRKNVSYENESGLNSKQNKVNMLVSNKSFIKRLKVLEVTSMAYPHLWIVYLIPCNTRVASSQLPSTDATWHLKTSIYIKRSAGGGHHESVALGEQGSFKANTHTHI